MLDKKLLLIGALAVTTCGASVWSHLAKTTSQAPAPAAPKQQRTALAAAPKTDPAPAAAPVDLVIAEAIQQRRIQAEFKSNGKDKLVLAARNTGAQPIRLHLSAGQLFSSGQSTVALVRSREIELAPDASAREELPTVATTSANVPAEAACTLAAGALPQLAPLFAHLDAHPEISTAAAQTAVLALMENPPLGAVAKFAQPAQSSAAAFKAETCEIIAALSVLRAINMDAGVTLAQEPQLKIEAMIDPLAHAQALRFYNITDEWAYWKRELLGGDGSTRHYALYGIARFYPEVALQMLPTWAREARTSQVYRISAVQALAETQRPEALSALRQLEREFGADTDLGKAAHAAAGYLDAQFAKSQKLTVAFRASPKNFSALQTRAAVDVAGITAAN